MNSKELKHAILRASLLAHEWHPESGESELRCVAFVCALSGWLKHEEPRLADLLAAVAKISTPVAPGITRSPTRCASCSAAFGEAHAAGCAFANLS